MKKYLLFFTIFTIFTILTLALTACSPKPATENLKLKIVTPSGVPSLTIMRMIHENIQFDHAQTTYEISPNTDTLTAAVMTGAADIAIVPTNLAAILFNREVDYRLVAAVNWGNLYVLSTDPSVRNWADIAGKNIHTFGRGLVPDATFSCLLAANGINADKDVNITYLSTPMEVAQMMISGMSRIAVLREPVVTQVLDNSPNARIILDLQKEWTAATKSGIAGYPQASLIIRRELLDSHPDIMAKITDAIEADSIWANLNPVQLGMYAEAHDETLNGGLIAASLERLNIRFIRAGEAKAAITGYLETLYRLSPDFTGGKIPDESFFHIP